MNFYDYLICGLVVAIFTQGLATYLKYKSDENINRRKLTADLQKEFNDHSMAELRNRADSHVTDHQLATIDKLAEIAQEKKCPNNLIDVLTVMRFYHRMALLYNSNSLDRELVLLWFGRVYVWWYIVYFEKGFATWEGVHADLARFHLDLRDRAALKYEHNQRWKKWHIEAKKALEKRAG